MTENISFIAVLFFIIKLIIGIAIIGIAIIGTCALLYLIGKFLYRKVNNIYSKYERQERIRKDYFEDNKCKYSDKCNGHNNKDGFYCIMYETYYQGDICKHKEKHDTFMQRLKGRL